MLGDRLGRQVEHRRRRRAEAATTVRMRVPVSILPPRSSSSDASALVIDWEPPAATGQPWRCPAVRCPGRSPRSSGSAAAGRHVRQRLRTAPAPGRCETTWRGLTAGSTVGGAEPGQRQRMVGQPQQRTHDVLGERIEPRRRPGEQRSPARAVGPRPSAVVVDRAIQHPGTAAVERMDTVDLGPAARAVRNGRGPAPARNGEPTAIGWIAEQWSCNRPGRIASLLRVPPPISSAASSTVDLDAGLEPGRPRRRGRSARPPRRTRCSREYLLGCRRCPLVLTTCRRGRAGAAPTR